MTIQEFIDAKRAEWDRLRLTLDEVRRRRLSRLRREQVRALGEQYRRAASDLAYAQTYFPGTQVVAFLNDLVGRAYHLVYRVPRTKPWSLRRFFAVDLPSAFRQTWRYTAVAAALFVATSALGIVLARARPEWAPLLVPRRAIERIEEARLWTEEVEPQAVLSAALFTNNITVALMTFAFGIFLGVGTVFFLAFNGVFLGAILGLCAEAGVLGRMLWWVWPHGPLELSTICLAGGAGLVVGSALLAPGDLPRRDALRMRGRDGITLALGCVPLLIVAGLVEGLVSPSHILPYQGRMVLGVLLALGMWGYLILGGLKAPTKP